MNPALVADYYCIGSMGTSGGVISNQVAAVTMGKGIASYIFIYPNPVVNKTVCWLLMAYKK